MFTQEISDTSGALPAVFLGGLGVVLVVIGLLLVLALFKWGRRALLVVGIIAPILLLGGAILLFAASSWSFDTLYISVDDRALEVGFRSPYKEQIPLQNITQCEATSYDWHDYRGLAGVHTSQKGKLYNVEGDGGIATDLTLQNEPNKHLLFSSPDPQAVCDALQERRPAIKET